MAGSRRDESERRTRETKDEKVDRLIRDLNRLRITIYLQVPLLDPTICASYGHKTTHERQCRAILKTELGGKQL